MTHRRSSALAPHTANHHELVWASRYERVSTAPYTVTNTAFHQQARSSALGLPCLASCFCLYWPTSLATTTRTWHYKRDAPPNHMFSQACRGVVRHRHKAHCAIRGAKGQDSARHLGDCGPVCVVCHGLRGRHLLQPCARQIVNVTI